ncbi:MAG: helix-turn-helix domain-containing protein [Clostridiaceae bacterium]|nr:helix-turn-helix domain-containing protein [Clostridiaceae bacterium]
MNQKQIGKNIKKRREEMGMTQAELAEKANISVVHVSHIENGKVKMSLDTLLAMCHALDNTPNDILLGEYLFPKADNSFLGEVTLNQEEKLLLRHISDFLVERHKAK